MLPGVCVGNRIEAAGAMAWGEALKMNIALQQLQLGCMFLQEGWLCVCVCASCVRGCLL